MRKELAVTIALVLAAAASCWKSGRPSMPAEQSVAMAINKPSKKAVSTRKTQIDELVICIEQNGFFGRTLPVPDTKEDGLTHMFVLTSVGVEDQLEDDVVTIGAYVVGRKGKDLGWRQETGSPEVSPTLTRKDFDEDMNRTLASYHCGSSKTDESTV